jgi:hypothetical protein
MTEAIVLLCSDGPIECESRSNIYHEKLVCSKHNWWDDEIIRTAVTAAIIVKLPSECKIF